MQSGGSAGGAYTHASERWWCLGPASTQHYASECILAVVPWPSQHLNSSTPHRAGANLLWFLLWDSAQVGESIRDLFHADPDRADLAVVEDEAHGPTVRPLDKKKFETAEALLEALYRYCPCCLSLPFSHIPTQLPTRNF